MSFEEKLLHKYIRPAISEKGFGDLAVIMETNQTNNTVNIMIQNSENPTMGELRIGVEAPYTPGIESINLYPGDKVWVQYMNGDRAQPYITAIYPQGQSQYKRHKSIKALHTRNLLT